MCFISPVSTSLKSFSNASLVSLIILLPPFSPPLDKGGLWGGCRTAKALNSAVTGVLRFLSILTLITPSGSVSNSSQAPRLGITLAPKSFRLRQFWAVKKTPAERISWLTTTLSTPFTMKVPRSVISGKSPRYTSCSLDFLVRLLISSNFTLKDASYDKLFSFAFNSSNFGSSK